MRPTLYAYAGGEPALLALTTAFHARCLADPELNHPFTHADADPEHVPRLAAYWGEVLGGPARFSAELGDESGMVRLHTGNGDMSDLGERFVRCFDEAVAETLPDDPGLRRCLHDYQVWAVADVLSYAEADDVPEGLVVPRWGWEGLLVPPSVPAAP